MDWVPPTSLQSLPSPAPRRWPCICTSDHWWGPPSLARLQQGEALPFLFQKSPSPLPFCFTLVSTIYVVPRSHHPLSSKVLPLASWVSSYVWAEAFQGAISCGSFPHCEVRGGKPSPAPRHPLACTSHVPRPDPFNSSCFSAGLVEVTHSWWPRTWRGCLFPVVTRTSSHLCKGFDVWLPRTSLSVCWRWKINREMLSVTSLWTSSLSLVSFSQTLVWKERKQNSASS